MAEQLYFSRDSKLYLEFANKVWEIPVLDGFSFSQSTNQSEISLSEMQGADGLSRRGARVFTDSLAPAEWSFSTYVRPFKFGMGTGSTTDDEHHAVEEALWAVMAGADAYTATTAGETGKGDGGIGASPTITTASSGMTNGVYSVTEQDTGVVVKASGGSTVTDRLGWELDVTVSGGAVSGVAVVTPGAGFSTNDTINIDRALFGGTTGTDVVLTVGNATSAAGATFYRAVDPDSNSGSGPAVVIPTTTSQVINFGQSNRAVLGECNLYFVMETAKDKPMVYKLANAAVNEASIDFEVDGIATINWSGFAKTITDLQSAGSVTVNTSTAPATATGGTVHIKKDSNMLFTVYSGTGAGVAKQTAIRDGVDSTNTFIRNRLTQLKVEDKDADTTAFPSTNYNLTLTGGNITISNNITYLVPEELGAVNVPIEHVTGGRTCNGSFTCYLTLDDVNSNVGTSVELFNDMTNSGTGGALKKVVNNFEVQFEIGGNVAGQPMLHVTIPKCHIDVPTHSVEDVISVETNFGAYTDDFSVANELSLEYFGVAV